MTTVSNPILPGCHPDPSICRVGDTYWLVTSTFEYLPGLPVFRSTDLVGWEQVGHVVDRPGQLDLEGVGSSGGLYAPTLRHHDGLFWVVCTLVPRGGRSRGGNFLMTATDPAGPWSDPVWLGVDGIDPSIFFDDDGRAWVHGTRLAADPEWHDQTEVWIRELDLSTKALTGPEHVVWTGAVRGAVWAEGPHLYKVDGTYYLLAAEGGTDLHHAISVARSDSVAGPYEGCRSNPVLTHRDLGRGADVVGVGHADLVQAVDGSWWSVLLAMRPYGGYHYNLGRETFLVPVAWEDGWPLFAPGVARVTATVEVPTTGPVVLGASQGTTSGVVGPQDLRWTALRSTVGEVATPRGEGWELPLRPARLTEPTTPAFLGLRQQHRDVDVTAVLRVDLAAEEEAGLVVRQSEQDHVRLALTARDGQRLVTTVHVRSGEETELGRLVLDTPTDEAVVLTASVRGQDYRFLVGRPDDGGVVLETVDGRTLDSVGAGGFLGVWLGVYGSSDGRPTSTVAHVEQVEYRPVG